MSERVSMLAHWQEHVGDCEVEVPRKGKCERVVIDKQVGVGKIGLFIGLLLRQEGKDVSKGAACSEGRHSQKRRWSNAPTPHLRLLKQWRDSSVCDGRLREDDTFWADFLSWFCH